jgi:hypothetical protein
MRLSAWDVEAQTVERKAIVVMSYVFGLNVLAYNLTTQVSSGSSGSICQAVDGHHDIA